MQITTDFSIICESTPMDPEKNSISLVNLLDEVFATKLPASISDLKLVNRFTVLDSGDTTRIPLAFELVHPDKSATPIDSPEGGYVVDIKPQQKRQRTGIIIGLTIDIKKEGVHTVRTLHNGVEIGLQTLDVTKVE